MIAPEGWELAQAGKYWHIRDLEGYVVATGYLTGTPKPDPKLSQLVHAANDLCDLLSLMKRLRQWDHWAAMPEGSDAPYWCREMDIAIAHAEGRI